MKYIFILFSFFVIFQININAQVSIQSDVYFGSLNHILTIDNTILITSNSGEVFRSIDKGNHWERKQIVVDENPFLDIMSWSVYKNQFIILINKQGNSVIYKSNDGINWSESNIKCNPKCKYFSVYEDKLFMLNELDNVHNYTIDEYSNSLLHETIFSIDSLKMQIRKIEKFNNCFVVYQQFDLLIYNTNYELINKLPLSSWRGENNNGGYSYARDFNILGDKLFFISSNVLYESIDGGYNWKLAVEDTVESLAIVNNEINMIHTYMNKKDDMSNGELFLKITKYGIDSSEVLCNFNLKTQFLNFEISETKYISENTVIIIGSNNLILVSKDNGFSWEMINYLKTTKPFAQAWKNDQEGYIGGQGGLIYKTTNGGNTWLPSFYSDSTKIRFLSMAFVNTNYVGINKVGNIFALDFNKYYNSLEANYLISTDGGVTYKSEKIAELPREKPDIFPNFFITDSFHIVYYPYIQNISGNIQYYHTNWMIFDNNCNLFDSFEIADYSIWGHKLKNKVLYAVADKATDSIICQKDFYLIKSDDLGKNWTNIKKIEIDSGATTFVFAENYFDNINYDTTAKNIIIKRFNLESGEFIKSTAFSSNYIFSGKYVVTQGNAFLFGNLGDIFINENIHNDLSAWRKYNGKGLSFFKPHLVQGNKIFGNYSSTAFAVMSLSGMTGVVDNTESGDYIYAMPPYPVPAKDYVKGKFYYDYAGGLSKTDINIYNCFGAKVAGKKDIEITSIESNYTAELKWNCSQALPGVYMIVITTPGGKSQTMPVMVAR